LTGKDEDDRKEKETYCSCCWLMLLGFGGRKLETTCDELNMRMDG
jgi:hypothetical protein